MIIEDYIARWASLTPGKVAISTPSQQLTYGALWALIGQRAAELRASGVAPGSVVPLRVSQNGEFLADYFAVHLIGAVALPLEHEMPAGKYEQAVTRFCAVRPPSGTADILLTTGTTGKAKGALVSHQAIISNAENLASAHGYGSDLTFIVCGPLNHIGCLSKVWPVMMLGATLHVLEGMKNLPLFFQTIERSRTQVATFLVPALVRILVQLAAKQLEMAAAKIDFIECGAAPLTGTDMLRLCELLPHTRLYNTYASTETGVVCTYNFNDGYCLSGCVGSPMRHAQVRLTAEGIIVCSGPMLMTGYADDDELTQQVLRQGSLYTSDRGHLDSKGRLILDGRTDDIINVGGYKISPEEVEQVAMTMPGVADCVCVGTPAGITGFALKLLVVPAAGEPMPDKRSLARHIAEQLEAYKVPTIYEQTDAIVRTFNGKINRAHYRFIERKTPLNL